MSIKPNALTAYSFVSFFCHTMHKKRHLFEEKSFLLCFLFHVIGTFCATSTASGNPCYYRCCCLGQQSGGLEGGGFEWHGHPAAAGSSIRSGDPLLPPSPPQHSAVPHPLPFVSPRAAHAAHRDGVCQW